MFRTKVFQSNVSRFFALTCLPLLLLGCPHEDTGAADAAPAKDVRADTQQDQATAQDAVGDVGDGGAPPKDTLAIKDVPASDVDLAKKDIGLDKSDISSVKYDVGVYKYDFGVYKYDLGVYKYDLGVYKYDLGPAKYDVGPAKYDVGVYKYDSGPGKYDVGVYKYDSGPGKLDVSVYKYDVGVYKYDVGTVKYDVGVYKYDVGVYKYDVGVYKYDVGSVKYDVGPAKYDFGVYKYDFGPYPDIKPPPQDLNMVLPDTAGCSFGSMPTSCKYTECPKNVSKCVKCPTPIDCYGVCNTHTCCECKAGKWVNAGVFDCKCGDSGP